MGWIFGTKVTHPAVPTPDYRALKKATVFLKSELRVLFARFCGSCGDDGLLSKANLMFMPELTFYPFAALAFHYEAEKSKHPGQGIDFEGFVTLLSYLSPKTDPHSKVEYLCAVLKVGSDAPPETETYMHREEVSAIMYQICLGNVIPPVLDKIVDTMWENITAADPAARERGITKSDLAALFCSLDLQTFLTCPF